MDIRDLFGTYPYLATAVEDMIDPDIEPGDRAGSYIQADAYLSCLCDVSRITEAHLQKLRGQLRGLLEAS